MPWISFETKIFTDPNLFKLAESMGWEKHETVGRLIQLWCWCLDHAEDGRLDKLTHGQISSSANVPNKQSKKFIKSLIACEFLDDKPLRIRDWLDCSSRYLYSKYHNSNPNRLKEIAKLCNADIKKLNKDLADKPKRTVVKKKLTFDEKVLKLDGCFNDKSFMESVKTAYPDVNYKSEKAKMVSWMRSEPVKSNKSNWERFINLWLGRAQRDWESKHGQKFKSHDKKDRGASLKRITKKVELS